MDSKEGGEGGIKTKAILRALSLSLAAGCAATSFFKDLKVGIFWIFVYICLNIKLIGP